MRAKNKTGVSLASATVVLVSLCACSGPSIADAEAQYASGQFDASARSAQLLLDEQLERGAPPDECWPVQHLRLLSLAHAGRIWVLVHEWRTAQAIYASCITSDTEAELVAAATQAEPDGQLGERFQKLLISYPLAPDRNMPFGHPEGYPGAWLSPEEPGGR